MHGRIRASELILRLDRLLGPANAEDRWTGERGGPMDLAHIISERMSGDIHSNMSVQIDRQFPANIMQKADVKKLFLARGPTGTWDHVEFRFDLGG
jgi:hypothetical protein